SDRRKEGEAPRSCVATVLRCGGRRLFAVVVGDGDALDIEPAAARVGMEPALPQLAPLSVPHDQRIRPLHIRRLRRTRTMDVGLAARPKLRFVTRSAPGTGDEKHATPQCATAAAPCSSMSAPLLNRSSAKGTARG